MTEAEWLTTSDPLRMSAFAERRRKGRKLRLVGCGCARLLERYLSQDRMLDALARAERFADGELSESTAETWSRKAWKVFARMTSNADRAGRGTACLIVRDVCLPSRYTAYTRAWAHLRFAAQHVGFPSREESERWIAALFRDVFGNPFRRVSFNPRWLTADVVGLARGIYEERAFDRLPLLADALMDAGCDSDEILSHCRSQGPHVRGCWVVDVVLGKE